jgi:PqqA peptide cyclase
MSAAAPAPATDRPGPPLWLLAELTYRCPLHCVFCYNPTDFARHEQELSTEEWLRVLREAAHWARCSAAFPAASRCCARTWKFSSPRRTQLGLLHQPAHLGRRAERNRAQLRFKAAGLDHIQLSFQDSTRELNDFLSHTKTFELKSRVGEMLKAQGWPMVMNVVIHRLNIEHIDRIIAMADELGASYLELANTQYYSWAEVNRAHLLPTSDQLRRAEAMTDAWRRKGSRAG